MTLSWPHACRVFLALLLTSTPGRAQPHHAVRKAARQVQPAPSPLDSAQVQIERVQSGALTPEALLALYAAQIARHDPEVHAVIALNRQAESAAASESLASPLHGLPILLKDNIESTEFLPTTAGSTALATNLSHRDAPLVARLRRGGAVILGKTNLSEWANFRSTMSSSGWSATGGLTRNPWDPSRSACGSSSGSAAAVAAGFAGAAIGTETDGSITCPASLNGVVGLKPTLGLVSRTGIVPISPAQDTAGPLARSVADAALLLGVMAGSDPADPATKDADQHRADYIAAVRHASLQGARLGIMRFAEGTNPDVRSAFEAALTKLRAAGAVLIEVPDFDKGDLDTLEHAALTSEFRSAIDTYLAHTPEAVTTRDLAALIAYDRSHASAEMAFFGQDIFEEALRAPEMTDPASREARRKARAIAGPNGIDAMIGRQHLDALIAPTIGPAWTIDLVNGDRPGSGWFAGQLAAVAGDPHLSVPMALVHGLPVGLSFIGPAWSDATLLRLGAAWESVRGRAFQPPGF